MGDMGAACVVTSIKVIQALGIHGMPRFSIWAVLNKMRTKRCVIHLFCSMTSLLFLI